MSRPRIYVAGPYTLGDVGQNVRIALDAADKLFGFGFAPFVPHLTHLWHMLHARSWEDWMELDFVWLEQCEYLLRLPGESKGADMEVARANELGIPVFTDIHDVVTAVAMS